VTHWVQTDIVYIAERDFKLSIMTIAAARQSTNQSLASASKASMSTKMKKYTESGIPIQGGSEWCVEVQE
jgi:hypothetical protein